MRGAKGGRVIGLRARDDPVVAVLGLVAQHVYLMVARDALGVTARDQVAHQQYHPGTVWSPIAKVTDEYQPSPVRVLAMLVVAKALQQLAQRAEFAMHVADDVERSFEQRAYEGFGLQVASCLGPL
jgi:hypothetical protein